MKGGSVFIPFSLSGRLKVWAARSWKLNWLRKDFFCALSLPSTAKFKLFKWLKQSAD